MVNHNQKLDNKEMLSVLTEHTQKVVTDFTKHYSQLSYTQYVSAISNLFYALGKDDVVMLNISDLEKIQEIFRNKESKGSNDMYTESFFKYIYAFDIIKNPEGFEKVWIKKKLIKHFKGLLKEGKVQKEYIPALTLEEITNIQQLMDLPYQDNMRMLKISFCWYLIFDTDCTVNEIIKKMVARNYDYNSHTIKTYTGKEYHVPDKYIALFDYLKDRTFSGFNTVNEYITELCTIMGMRKITPQMIKNARRENMLKCSLCAVDYSNRKENWVSINDRIICIICGEELKKNTNNMQFEVNIIENENLNSEPITADLNIATIIYTFDELKKQLNKEIDYLNLHKFLMEIGNLGEAFVFDLEKRKLFKTKYEDYVSNLPARNPSYGYDIFSYDLDGTELYIEVKTELYENNDFYMSDYEFKMAQKMKSEQKKYLVYRVHNILAENKNDITYDIIEDITENVHYKFNVYNWKVSRN